MKLPANILFSLAAFAAATVHGAGPQVRSVFSVERIDPSGEKHVETAPPTPDSPTNNLVVQSVTLPTDGLTAATIAVAQGAPAPGESSAAAVDGTGPAGSTAATEAGTLELKVLDLFDPVKPQPLPKAYEPDADGVIIVSSGTSRPSDASDSINPFDPRGLRPLKTHETKVTVATIVHGIRSAAAINGTPAVVGSTVEAFVVSRIDDGFVLLSHNNEYFKIPSGKTVTIRTPER